MSWDEIPFDFFVDQVVDDDDDDKCFMPIIVPVRPRELHLGKQSPRINRMKQIC